jgi:hypothetical protein
MHPWWPWLGGRSDDALTAGQHVGHVNLGLVEGKGTARHRAQQAGQCAWVSHWHVHVS